MKNQQQRKGRRATHIPQIFESLQQVSEAEMPVPKIHTPYLFLSNTAQPAANAVSQQAIHVCNRVRGHIRSIAKGALLSEVIVDTLAGQLTSVMQTQVIQGQHLAPGSEVDVLIQATAVTLSRS